MPVQVLAQANGTQQKLTLEAIINPRLTQTAQAQQTLTSPTPTITDTLDPSITPSVTPTGFLSSTNFPGQGIQTATIDPILESLTRTSQAQANQTGTAVVQATIAQFLRFNATATTSAQWAI